MGKVILLNGSPRAPKSNSKGYAELFQKYCKRETEYYNISRNNHAELIAKLADCDDLVFVFPLYVDALPVTLMNFLKALEAAELPKKPTVSILINCGFLEHKQSDLAIDMMKYFCRKAGFAFGSSLKIGSGEAILRTPFKIFAQMNIKKLAASVSKQKYAAYQTAMPLSVKTFVKASTNYWTKYGASNGIMVEQMETMLIEDGKP